MENETSKTTVSVAELNEAIQQLPDGVFIIDLMNREDFEQRHIPGAVNIPVSGLESRLGEIPANKTIVVACKMGLMKSDMALQQLQKSGYTGAAKLAGGTAAWFDSKPDFNS